MDILDSNISLAWRPRLGLFRGHLLRNDGEQLGLGVQVMESDQRTARLIWWSIRAMLAHQRRDKRPNPFDGQGGFWSDLA